MKDYYALARTGVYIDGLGEATVFSTLDLNNYFRQAEVGKADQYSTASISQQKLYRFKRTSLAKHALPGRSDEQWTSFHTPLSGNAPLCIWRTASSL